MCTVCGGDDVAPYLVTVCSGNDHVCSSDDAVWSGDDATQYAVVTMQATPIAGSVGNDDAPYMVIVCNGDDATPIEGLVEDNDIQQFDILDWLNLDCVHELDNDIEQCFFFLDVK